MTSSPSLYNISIAGTFGPAPSDGFVDALKIERWLANAIGNDGINEASLDNFGTAVTWAASQAKRRANVRYTQIVAQLGFVGNMYVSNISAPGASAIASGSVFSFDVLVEHGDGSLQTWDELNPGTLLTNPATVLARAVSRALISNVVVQADILDPTPNTSVGVLGAANLVPRYGVRYESLAVGPLFASLTSANASIAVTPLYQPPN